MCSCPLSSASSLYCPLPIMLTFCQLAKENRLQGPAPVSQSKAKKGGFEPRENNPITGTQDFRPLQMRSLPGMHFPASLTDESMGSVDISWGITPCCPYVKYANYRLQHTVYFSFITLATVVILHLFVCWFDFYVFLIHCKFCKDLSHICL